MSLCVVCLGWSPGGGGGRFLLPVPPGDWSAPSPAAGTPPSRQTGSQTATGGEASTSPHGCRDPSTFWREGGDNGKPLKMYFFLCRL